MEALDRHRLNRPDHRLPAGVHVDVTALMLGTFSWKFPKGLPPRRVMRLAKPALEEFLCSRDSRVSAASSFPGPALVHKVEDSCRPLLCSGSYRTTKLLSAK